MKPLRYIAFGSLFCLIAVMVSATVLEKFYGSPAIAKSIYGAWWFVLLWGIAAVCSLAFIIKKKLYRRPLTFTLHLSFLVILTGAFITWNFGKQGMLHLRTGDESKNYFENKDGHAEHLPFSIQLKDFFVQNYPGTQSPMDYVSQVCIHTDNDSIGGEISMNKILRIKGYRFYQSSYDADLAGSILSVSHDPWGIAVTYTGYILLLLSMTGFFFEKNSVFRALLKHSALRKTCCCAVLLLTVSQGFAAQQTPPTLPRQLANEMGNLHVYYNGRICPLSTLAHDFCIKITKKNHYKNLNTNQFLSGWLFFYDYWREEPLVYIKSSQDRKDLGLQGSRARLSDFRGTRLSARSNESFALINMVSTQEMLKIFPYFDTARKNIRWASPVDRLPAYIGGDTAVFIRLSLDYLNELVAMKNYDEALLVVRKIILWQQRQAGGILPSKARFKAEQFYYRVSRPMPVAIAFLLIGFAAFLLYCRSLSGQRGPNRHVSTILLCLLCLGLLYLSGMLGIRAWVSGHWPLANGYETMQMIAWFTLLVALIFHRKLSFLKSFGFIVAGLAMMVSMMGSSNPQITPLMPVLASPLMSVHVMLVMVAYTLFAFMMLQGFAGLWLHFRNKETSAQLAVVSRLMLYPAVFTLAAGIFIGAVWANVSWGRYWGWDPKEVWALITLIVYSFALHSKSFSWPSRPAAFHIFAIMAFLCVLITYFGVNFLLGGMHGYV